ncbi:MAG: PilZ domain-containing protein [Oscillospiraceae bacterium]|nr:PilZ domain-containing protein [Oscillospiraceae bacterium]
MLEFDKRAYKRAICICEAEIIGDNKDEDNVKISVIDFAAGGIKFFTDNCKNEEIYNSLPPNATQEEKPTPCLTLGSLYKLRLLINEPGIDIVDIVINIKIRRADTRVGADNTRHYGASFEGLTPQQRIHLDEIVQYKNRHKNAE